MLFTEQPEFGAGLHGLTFQKVGINEFSNVQKNNFTYGW